MNAGVATLGYTAPVDIVPSTVTGTWQDRLIPRIEIPWAGSGATDANADSGFDHHFAKLSRLMKDKTLWPDGAEPPGPSANESALAMLAQLQFDQLLPSRVVASVEGGVAICFSRGNKYADVEFLNSGEILGVISNRRDRPVAWEIEASPRELARASVRIREFLDTREAPSNDSGRSQTR